MLAWLGITPCATPVRAMQSDGSVATVVTIDSSDTGNNAVTAGFVGYLDPSPTANMSVLASSDVGASQCSGAHSIFSFMYLRVPPCLGAALLHCLMVSVCAHLRLFVA